MQVVWFIVNIVLPMALPTIGAFAVMLIPTPPLPSPPPPPLKEAVLATVKDGQLGWGIVAMGLSTIYEFLEALTKAIPSQSKVTFWIVVAVIAAALMMAFAMLLAGVGASFPIPPRTGTAVPFFRYYKALSASLVMALIGAISFTIVHFTYS